MITSAAELKPPLPWFTTVNEQEEEAHLLFSLIPGFESEIHPEVLCQHGKSSGREFQGTGSVGALLTEFSLCVQSSCYSFASAHRAYNWALCASIFVKQMLLKVESHSSLSFQRQVILPASSVCCLNILNEKKFPTFHKVKVRYRIDLRRLFSHHLRLHIM